MLGPGAGCAGNKVGHRSRGKKLKTGSWKGKEGRKTRKGSVLETEQGRQMQSINMRIKTRENSKLWGMPGTGNTWEKM